MFFLWKIFSDDVKENHQGIFFFFTAYKRESLKAHVIYKGIHEKGLGDVVSVVFFVVFYKIFVFSDTL